VFLSAFPAVFYIGEIIMIKKLGVYGVTLVVMAVCVLCGCESDSGDSFNYGDNDPNVRVAFGDSITSGIGDGIVPYPPRVAAMTGQTVINEGIAGEHAYEAASRVWGVLNRHKPGTLMVLYGVNDIMHSADIDDIVNDLRTIVQAAAGNNTKVLIATMTPMIDRHNGIFQGKIEATNVEIRRMAAEEGVRLVDLEPLFGTGEGLQTDGLHPNDAGTEIMASAFR
jgi:lysophospholipase L1-like esterase